MRTRTRWISVVLAASFAAYTVARADVAVNSSAFSFSGNWPSYQPVASGSSVPSVATDIAAASAGATPFAISEYGAGVHTIAHLNDGLYGNSYSWISRGTTDARNVALGGSYGTVYMSFAGIALSNATPYTLSDIVVGRSAAGEYGDRINGNIYIQVTTSTDLSKITSTDASNDSIWTTLGYYTTTDVFEHMFTFNTVLNVTGVRIVTTAGNCIDEIVVHGSRYSLWNEDGGFVWTNVTGSAWSVGSNWQNGTSPNTIYDNVFFTRAPLSSKTVNNDTTYGYREGQGYQYGTLSVDSTLGDASPVVFTGDAFYLWLSDINVLGHVVMSNAVESFSEIRTKRGGEVTLTEWAPNSITQPKLHAYGGTLSVAGTVNSSTLPTGAWMHLDASLTNTMSLAAVGDGSYTVQQWNSADGSGPYAFAEAPANRPIWKVVDGIPHIDFGVLTFGSSGSIVNGKTLTWSAPSTGIRAAFLVYSDVAESQYAQSLLCSESVTANGVVDFCRGAGGVLINTNLVKASVLSGTQTIDSRHVLGGSTGLNSGFHVVAITTTGDAAADSFARDHLNHGGGQKLAEVVIYNRELSLDERRQAEAYLMRKWFGNPPPTDASAGAGQAASLTLESGATLNATTDFRTQNLTINGNATKTGAGQLTAGQITQTTGVLALNSGVLTVAGGMLSETQYVGTIPAPDFHLDASDYAHSMVTETAGDGAILVKSWSDLSNNGFVASAPDICTPPTLVTNGLNGLPYVDFGALTLFTNTSSHLLWNTTNWNIRTVVMLYSDSTNYCYYDGRDLRSCFLGNTYGNLDFWRGGEGMLADGNAHDGMEYGHMAVDGKTALASTYLPAGFHVLSFVTVSPTHSDAFARDLDNWTGGQRLAEVMIWSSPLSSPQLRTLEQQLMAKWFNRNRPGYPARNTAVPADDPWMHVDASDTASLNLVDQSGTQYVQQWNDVRTNGLFASASADAYRPIWRANNGFPYLDFGTLAGPMLGNDYGPHLLWSQTNTNIRALFLVYSDADSGYDQNFIGSLSGDLPYSRGGNHTFFNNSAANSYVLNGTHSLDYALVNGATTPLPSGFHVIGIANYHGKTVRGDVFARDHAVHAGGQKLAEVLVYNRELTDREFRQTRRYLMQKWFGAASDEESDLYHLRSAAGTAIDIGAGQTLTCRTNDCPATLEKRGAGRLILGAGFANDLSVTGGELWLEKPFTTASGTPLSALSLSANASVNLRGNAFTATQLSGSGTVSNGTVTVLSQIVPGTAGGAPQTLTVGGNLVLSSGTTIALDATAAAADKIAVVGALTLATNVQINATFPQGTHLLGSYPLFTFGSLAEAQDLASWKITVTPSGIYTVTLSQSANAINIEFHPRGTMMFVR